MSLRKSPRMTPAGLEANRRNAQHSTGPRTARGKAQSRLNSLRTGDRSRIYHQIMLALLNAPPCAVDRTARAVMTPEQAAHPLLAELVDIFRQAEIEIVLDSRERRAREAGKFFCDDRSRNVIENRG